MAHRGTMRAPVRRRFRVGDGVFRGAVISSGIGLCALLGLMLWVLGTGGAKAFTEFGLRFFTGKTWNATPGPMQSFGALPFIVGTLVTSAIAILLAVPISIGTALLLNEVRSGWLANPLAVFVDLLAAVPSVVYGLWALYVVLPFLDRTVEPFLEKTIGAVPVVGRLFSGSTNGPDLLTAGVILAVMILPIVTAVTREVVAIVPRDLREAAQALGATRYEVIRTAVLPYARGGIVGATMLGLGRALGETIAVAMVVGNGFGLGASLFRSGYTIPAIIANEFREATGVGVHRSALLALALILVLISLLLAGIARLLVRRTAGLVSGGTS
jgi:phosphate transport system permease protein